MRTILLSILVALMGSIAVAAQQSPSAVTDFSSLTSEEKRAVLVDVIMQRGSQSSANVATLLQAALGDPDPAFRQGALAALVSHATARSLRPERTSARDWEKDHAEFQRLRPDIVRAARDVDARVRTQAIAALVSLDVDAARADTGPSPATERVLVEQFYADPSDRVRAKIVSGFGTDSASSAAVIQLLTDAFADSAAAVRHAATGGAHKLDPDTAMRLLAGQLKDTNVTVRSQSATILAKFGVRASAYLPAIEDALRNETDGQAQEALGRAIAVIAGRR
jgi:hypothetical protein